METRKLRVRTGSPYEVIVAGGGPSGTMAAIAAARSGARTLIVDQQGFFGGSLTAMGVGPMMSFHNNVGEQVIRGLPQELVDRLVARGASPGHIEDTTTYVTTVTPFDSEVLKIELEQMVRDAGADILFHTQLADVQLDDGRIAEVVLCNKAGLTAYAGTVFIDASGDGDLATRSGTEFTMGRTEDGATQPMTMNLKVANVDVDRIRRYVMENPDDFVFANGQKEGLARLARTPRLSLAGYRRAWEQAKARGEVTVPREHVLFFETATPGIVIVNTSRVQGYDPTDPQQLSEAEMLGRQQCAEIFRFLQRDCPGFENAVRMDAAPQIGVRESRHVKGLYTLTSDDLVRQRDFPDPIALGGYPIDIHSPERAETDSVHFADGTTYQIPMRSLLVASPENLVIAGRCISATHEAMAAFRVTPIAMAIGQAAGTIAGVSVRERTAPSRVAYRDVRELLLANGAELPSEVDAA